VHAKNQAHLPEGGKARRIYLLLRDEIANGRYADSMLLPGEQRLADSFGVSRVTIRRALKALSCDGLVERRAGSGTRVTPAVVEAGPIAGDVANLLPQLVEMGRTTTARLLSFSYGPAPGSVRRALHLDEGAKVQTATRVRLIDARPFSHLTTYVPEDIAISYSEDDLAKTPLFQLLERSGVQIDEAQQSVSATLAAPDVAEALEISVGSALMSLRRVTRDSSGRGIEYLSALYRPDLFHLDMTLSRVGSQNNRHWEPRIGAPAPEEG
jgi:GntR family transcriptional regulator